MLFSSAIFLFGFAPLFFLIYFSVRKELQNLVLVAASLFFYAWAEPTFIFWALASTLLDYGIGRYLADPGRRARRPVLAMGIATNVALLAWFKYANFFADGLNQLFRALGWKGVELALVALPIAVSFIVFEKITYLVDIYRGQGRPAANLLLYLLYVFYFPKLLAGPIIRYRDIQEQLERHQASLADVRDGAVRFVYGMAKKVLLADPLGHIATAAFKLGPAELDFGTAWLGVFCFTAQIYFDFSGYSDMAIGLSRILGFRLNENFRMPYTAPNFTDFWRRWHISLSSWIRDYLYIPLGGNRGSTARTYFNLCLCFFLSGLWHGAAWNFVVWGLFHGAMLTADRVFYVRWQQRLPHLLNVATCFLLVMVSWVIFRAESFGQMGFYLKAMFSLGSATQPNLLWFSPQVATELLVSGVLVFTPLLAAWPALVARYRAWPRQHEFALAGTLLLFGLSVARMAGDSYQAFIYFRF